MFGFIGMPKDDSYNHESNIEAYLSLEEVQNLGSGQISGVVEDKSTNTKYPLTLEVNGKSDMKISGTGFRVQPTDGEYSIFIQPHYYEQLKTQGCSGGRASEYKVDFYTESTSKFKGVLRRLELAKQFKERIELSKKQESISGN
jgi:hypothetical protein